MEKKSDTSELSASKTRILEAALGLFSRQGVAGTSLQMIADEIGVTKAAIYHQFRTKMDIVVAVAGWVLSPLEKIQQEAASIPVEKRREFLIKNLVARAVENRQIAGFLQRDAVILELFEQHPSFKPLMIRMNELLLEGNDSTKARVSAAMIFTSLASTFVHPLVADIDDDTLRDEMASLLVNLGEVPETN